MHTDRAARTHCTSSQDNADRRFFRAYHFPPRDKPAPSDESGERNDSIWAVVAGTVKAFNLSIDYVLYDMSYANVILYGATLPTYISKRDKDGKDKETQPVIRADDPNNRDKVMQFFNSIE
ncbi:MAG: hypothetical protein MJY71_02425 [Bacteroidaceae bacterium]|nr:hypothetical protein [Bacteroidaceae bacterium]